MKRLSLSRPLLFGVLAAVVVVGLWYELLWSPQSASLASGRHREQDASTAYIVASQRLGHLKRQASRAEMMNQLAARLDDAVPNHDDLDGLITRLNDDAQKAGVGLTTLSVVQPGGVSHAASGAIPIQMSVSGGYFAIHRFLDAVRDGARLVVVDSVTLSSGSAGTGSKPADGTALSANVAGRFFVSTSSAAPAPTSAGAPKVGGSKPAGGTGSLEVPINKARSAATAVSQAAATSGKP